MNKLNGYSVYPQINIDVNNIFTVKLFTLEGECMFDDIGVGRSPEEARVKAKALVQKEIVKYKMGE